MHRRVLTLLLTAMLLLSCVPAAHAEETRISAASAVVYEPRTGTVLYEKEPDRRMLIASTTKIMTALVALEHCTMDELVPVTAAHAAVEGSSAYLMPGESYRAEELLYALLLVSGNDAAAALADHVGGSMAGFAALMNEKCAELGLENTHFVNSHGLDDPEHYSTARDLALLTAAAMENADFCRMFGAARYEENGRTYVNHNKLLQSCPGCIGGKTGYTKAAGRILVSCTERDGLRLICVTVSDPDDWRDHAALYDALFAAWRYIPLPGSRAQRIPIVSGTRTHAALRAGVNGVLVPHDAEAEVRVFLPRFFFAPVLRGTQAGTAELWLGGERAGAYPLYFAESVTVDALQRLTAWERFRRAWFLSARQGTVYYPDF